MIFVTAGHVDHGKTALLEALTGTNTAHLPEEKKRGLTIDLGYAYMPYTDANGQAAVLGFIDVPGHQKFLSNMLAGLGGVDHALLVVSAEEGVKPQTVEHLTLLGLLHFRQITLVITKADRVEPAKIETLISQIHQKFPQLADAPYFVTSAYTGQGITELRDYLIAHAAASQLTEKPFRYAIDRVFSVKGAGVVVTGTAVSGTVHVGDSLYLSNGEKVRIKAIHAQNQPSEQGVAGERLALNLANVEKAEMTRGDWLTALAPDFATDRITVRFQAQAPLKESNAVHLYHFASHTTAKFNLLSDKQAVKFSQGFAEIILDTPLHIAVGDKLILRSGDDQQTLAGAVVVEIDSPKRHKRTEARLAEVAQLAAAQTPSAYAAVYLAQKAVEAAKLQWMLQLSEAELAALDLGSSQKWLYQAGFKQQLQAQVLEKMAAYHAEHQDQLGVTKARLYRMALLAQPEALANFLIDTLIEEKQLLQTRGWIHLPDHRIEFDAKELPIWQQIQPLFAATTQALWVREVAQALSLDETFTRNLLYKAGKLGYLIPIVKDRFLLSEQIAAFADLIRAFIAEHGEISVNQLRDEIQYGRKLTVQLIEYFDRTGFLRRKGNVHLLRDQETFKA
ncbi:selenocysteine-specific translation elongation factor [Haemophilus sputorum HK 2154]|uniref:selenocysteine-specific translation elongation factor n=1 Tax=Haemophilus sputorum TaxID=1078480 RepID=UPI00027A46DC|nr:selenocysteine-specific translation elongation factor [Haemophilus sputorum]EJP28170.1 selenocysteine-specific translation elongation factor [Haemophilus sputorum HK 2154]